MDQQQPAPPQPYNPVPQSEPTPPPTQPSKEHLKLNPLAVMQPDEKVIAEIRRHPFGIIIVYLFSLVGFAGACGAILLFAPQLFPDASTTAGLNTTGLIDMGILLGAMVFILAIVTMVYWQNRWIVTSDSVTQITQRSIFDRQISQLSFGNLEDVTAEQSGIIPNMFGFGTLKVETAGEHSKFYFIYCPNPNFYARQILMAREIFLQEELSGTRRLNRL